MKLVVFDCDGVLVDSEALAIGIEAEMLTAAGFAVDPDEIAQRFIGLSYSSMLATLGRQYGRPVPEALSLAIQRAALDLFPTRLHAVPGIAQLLASLELPCCVASSSDVDRIGLSLRVCGLDRHFPADHIFSAQMVANGKPAPDLFLLAAEKMRVDPGDCIVVEDSPPGVLAARAAGMRVVGFVAGSHAWQGLDQRLIEAGASEVVATSPALARHLAALAAV